MTVALTPFEGPPDAVISYLTKSNSLSMLHMQKSRVKFIATNTHKKNKLDPSVRTNIPLLTPTGQYFFTVQFDNDNDPTDIVSFFCKEIYLVKNLIVITSNLLQTVVSLLDTGAGPVLINKVLLSPSWMEAVRSIQSSPCEWRATK